MFVCCSCFRYKPCDGSVTVTNLPNPLENGLIKGLKLVEIRINVKLNPIFKSSNQTPDSNNNQPDRWLPPSSVLRWQPVGYPDHLVTYKHRDIHCVYHILISRPAHPVSHQYEILTPQESPLHIGDRQAARNTKHCQAGEGEEVSTMQHHLAKYP